MAFDFICPWCYIGKRNLDRSIEALKQQSPELEIQVNWHGIQLLPDIPLAGLNYEEFYMQRLGDIKTVNARHQQVVHVAKAVGLTLALENIELMPNTARLHKVFEIVQSQVTSQQAASLLETIFQRYFVDGKSLIDITWLEPTISMCEISLSKISEREISCYHTHREAWRPTVVPAYRCYGQQFIYGVQSDKHLLRQLSHFVELHNDHK